MYNVHMKQAPPYYVLNREVFQAAMASRGFRSTADLAANLGIHRNSISNYLNGSPVFPEVLHKILNVLRIDIANALKLEAPSLCEGASTVATLVDQIAAQEALSCVVLFGSRARGTPKRFSDYDLGVYSEKVLPFSKFSEMLPLVDDWNESHMQTAQLTNLSLAEPSFLEEIGPDLRLLAGSYVAWLGLLKKAEVSVYGR